MKPPSKSDTGTRARRTSYMSCVKKHEAWLRQALFKHNIPTGSISRTSSGCTGSTSSSSGFSRVVTAAAAAAAAAAVVVVVEVQ